MVLCDCAALERLNESVMQPATNAHLSSNGPWYHLKPMQQLTMSVFKLPAELHAKHKAVLSSTFCLHPLCPSAEAGRLT